jgi:hypothetical protein
VGIQQALFAKVFAQDGAHAIAYSVGQQIVVAALTAGTGLFAVLFIFRFRSFKEVVHAGREDRAAEKRGAAGGPGGEDATAGRSGLRERV